MKHVEREIYLYDELDPGELGRVKEHIAACAQCQALFALVRRQREIVQQIPAEMPDNQAALTSRIMSNLEFGKSARKSFIDRMWTPLQAGLVPLSLMLVVVFFFEFADTPSVTRLSTKLAGEIPLNSSLFLRAHDRLKKSSFSTFQCFYACRHFGDNACMECKSKIDKLNK